jgi:hypothetical protein
MDGKDFLMAAGVCVAMVSTITHAQTRQTGVMGDAATAWLALQASNSAAANAQPMPGAQASAAYARYMKSFDTAIPEHYGSSIENTGKSSPGVSGGN